MPTTTASDDKALLDAIEEQVMNRNVIVELKHIWFNAHRSDAWHVSYKMEASGGSGKQIAFASGGGNTLREALTRAFTTLVENRLGGSDG